MQTYQQTILILSVIGLSACATLRPDSSFNHNQYDDYNNNSPLYPESYESTSSTTVYPTEENSQKFMNTMAVSNRQPAKDMDHQWIESQSAQAYTIVLSNSEHPSSVASALSQAPKNQRMAEIKYQKGNQTYYEGLYGSYASREAAEEAYNALPAELKSGANVAPWSAVQRQVEHR
jgi:septal ring-binding cell division protein DamX